MSMPVSFIPSAAPVSPAGAGAAASRSDGTRGGARFSELLGGVAPRPHDTRRPRREDDHHDRQESAAAAGVVPPPAGGLVRPNTDPATPAPDTTNPAPARPTVVVATPPNVAVPAQVSTVDTGATPSTGDAEGAPYALVAAAADDSSATAGDTGAETGGGRQPDGTAMMAAAGMRADGAASTGPVSPSQPAQQAPVLPPAAQIALKLAPLRTGPDGTHQLTIVLNPDNLGPVSVVATVKGDQLSVQLTGSGAGAEALRAALPDLEAQLRDDGFSTLSLNVRETPRVDAAPRPAWASAAAATNNATDGTAATTPGAKTGSQPIGQPDHPAGAGTNHNARPDQPGSGIYNAAGQVVTAGQAAGGPGTGTNQGSGNQSAQQQLNLGQHGGDQPEQYGTAGRHDDGERRGTGHHGGTERLPGRPETGEVEQRSTNRPTDLRPANERIATRSVDLRV